MHCCGVLLGKSLSLEFWGCVVVCAIKSGSGSERQTFKVDRSLQRLFLCTTVSLFHVPVFVPFAESSRIISPSCQHAAVLPLSSVNPFSVLRFYIIALH